MFELSSLMIAGLLFFAAIRYLPFSWNQERLTLNASTQPVLISKPDALVPVKDEQQSGFVDPSPLAVREIGMGKATVLVRYRESKKTATANLIIWAGKRKGLHDSYYDLGARPATALGDKIVADFVQLGREKLAELEALGTAKRASRKRAVQVPVTQAVPAEQTVAKEPVQTATTDDAPQPSVVRKSFPSITRGALMHIGPLDKVAGEKTKKVYGVVVQEEDRGTLVTLWGSDLKRHVEKLGLKLGEKVEIIKLGRQILDPNKAPMNLYAVAKL